VVQVREKLQESMDVDMRQYKALINEEMLVVMRQMDSASKILSYLYLGSEWNASNLDELQENRFIALQYNDSIITLRALSRQKGYCRQAAAVVDVAFRSQLTDRGQWVPEAFLWLSVHQTQLLFVLRRQT